MQVAGYIGQAFRMLEKEQPLQSSQTRESSETLEKIEYSASFTIYAFLACSEETPLHSTQCSQHQVLKAPNAKSTTHVI